MDASQKLSKTVLILAAALSMAATASAATLTVSQGTTPGSPVVITPGSNSSVSLTNPGTAAGNVGYKVDFTNAPSSVYAYQGLTSTSQPCTVTNYTYCVAVGATETLVISAGATAGSGYITLNLSDSSTIKIYVTVGSGSTTGTTGSLIPSVSPISLTYSSTSYQYPSYVSVTSTTPETFSATPATTNGVAWLLVNNSATAAGGLSTSTYPTPQFYVTVGPLAASLPTGVYYGSITLTNANPTTDITVIPVTLSVNGATVGTGTSTLVEPASLSFACQVNNCGYQSATFLVSGSGTVSTSVTLTSANWPANTGIGASASGTAPTTVYVTASGGLPAGTYTAQVTVSTSGSYLYQVVPVTVTVYSNVALVASPQSLTWLSAPYYNQGLMLTSSDAGNVTPTVMGLSVISSASWLSVTGCGTTTPADCTVSINSALLSGGLNTAYISVSSTNNSSNPLFTVPVAVLYGGGGPLTFNPTSLTFTASGSQTLDVIGQNTSFSAAVTSGATWLSVSPSSYTAVPSPGTPVTVTVDGSSLSAGTPYTGTISFTPSGSTTAQNVSVSFTPSSTSGTVAVVNSTLPSFTAQAGGAITAAQTDAVYSTSGTAGVTFSYSTSASWLLVSTTQTGTGTTSGSASTPTTLYISVNPANLGAGNYSGTVTVGSATIIVGVTVTAASTVSAGPTSLSFAYMAGATAATPASATVTVSGTTGAQFTASASSTGNWLGISSTSGTIPASGSMPLTVTLQNLSSLTVSSTPYTGTITVAAAGGATGSTTIDVSLTVSAPLPTITSVTNAASYNSGPLSAGEIIAIFGTQMGPATGVALTSSAIANNILPFTLGGVSVTVGGYPAPMLYASAGQISAVVPYQINSPVYLQNAQVIVKYLNQTSNGLPETQAAAAPGIFTANSSGSGPGAILNSDLSFNCNCSTGRPANKGEVVVLYLTGEGQTLPAGVTGAVNPSTAPFAQPVQAPLVTINGQPAQVVFYGEAPGLVAGVLQINAVIPATAVSGQANPVVVSFGGAYSQMTAASAGAVTVAVK